MRHLGRIARTRLLIGASAAAILCSSGAALAQDRPPITIAPQPLAAALYEFGGKTGTQVIFPSSLATAKQSRGVAGVSDERVALTQLLTGTGLGFRREGDVFVIVQQEGGGGPQDGSAAGGGADGYAVEALIVTAQKKEEQIQDVPIAISAFTQKSLDAQKIEGGFDLLKAIPNVTFSKSNFSGYNFSIRGIGTKAVSATTDPGVAVAFNNSTLIVNRLFEQEYFDVERVEVLRGPQGTLYGRNATSGVINVISAKPRLMEFEGDIKLEVGNYNAQRVKGMINIPIGERFAIRGAGAMTKRDGFGFNEFDGSDVDDRDLWSSRVTIGFEPVEQVRINAMWEHFEEDDKRVRTSKQLCHHDAGPEEIGGFDLSEKPVLFRAATSQGCLPGSLYADAAFGTPNGASLPYIFGANYAADIGAVTGLSLVNGFGGNPYYSGPLALSPGLTPRCVSEGLETVLAPFDRCQPDPYGGRMQSADLRTISSQIEPVYRAKADVFELSIDLDLTDSLSFTSQTVYAKDDYYASQDYNRFGTLPIINDSSIACGQTMTGFFGNIPNVDCTIGYADGFFNVAPRAQGSPVGSPGVFCDPQLGCSSSLVAMDLSKAKSDQFNQEVRLASNFDGPINFSLGANYTRFETRNDYYVFINAATLIAHLWPFNTPNSNIVTRCPSFDRCVYIDPNPIESINGEGHNYFRSANPYELNSSAIFGELYWQMTDTVKLTAGARMSWDRKVFTPIPSQLLLVDYRNFVAEGDGPEACVNQLNCTVGGTGVDGRGSPANPDIVQEWREPTGRVIVDWKPDMGFTDETMLYASVSHGYKGGGANPPGIANPTGLFNTKNSGVAAPPTFEPEFIDAFEVGTKNTLLGGALVLNGAAFFYDYKGYQVSKIVDRSAANENFDAKIWGAELEWVYSPTRNLRFNGAFGALRTEIAEGARSLDLMDRTQGGDQFFITAQPNPNYDPMQEARPRSEYVAGVDAPADQEFLAYDEWAVLKPWLLFSSNCIAPAAVIEALLSDNTGLLGLCGGGGVQGIHYRPGSPLTIPGIGHYDPATDAPNGGAGFLADISGHELPNAPHWTASLGAQYRFALPGGWDGTLRGDFYWQSQSYARVYNTQYDKLRAWTNTNISLWVENPDWGVTAEVYVKNVFDETPITDSFLNSDDSGLTTNVFTLDPRLIGVSVRKAF